MYAGCIDDVKCCSKYFRVINAANRNKFFNFKKNDNLFRLKQQTVHSNYPPTL